MPRHSSVELRLFGASLAVLALVAASLTTRALGGGSVSLAALDTATTQNFDSLASAAGTAHKALPAGWFLNETGTSARNNDACAVSTGSYRSVEQRVVGVGGGEGAEVDSRSDATTAVETFTTEERSQPRRLLTLCGLRFSVVHN